MATAPDLAEPIVAWRTWRVLRRPEGLRLASVVYSTVWEPRLEVVGECRARRRWGLPFLRRAHDPHHAPEARCDCGIYAAKQPGLAGLYATPGGREEREVVARVIGLVSLWGRVLACKRGWRAEVAYPARIYVPHTTGRRSRVDAVEELAFALTDYGVPVEIVPHRGGRDLVNALSWLHASRR